VADAVTAPVVWVPLVGLAPAQAPEAAQEAAFDADHCKVALAPLATMFGLADRLTTGGGGVTDTVVDWVAAPAGPLQVNVKVVFAVSAPVGCEPLIALLPAQPPAAVHRVALALDQVSVAAPPEFTVLGDALKVTVGGALTETMTDCEASPPGPLQINS
jgi:hypothetical protein